MLPDVELYTRFMLKNDFSFSLWKLLNSPLPTLNPLSKICDVFYRQALISMALLLPKIVSQGNDTRFYFSLKEEKLLRN